MKSGLLGALLLIGAALTFIWMLVCPSYRMEGATRTYHMVHGMQGDKHSEPFDHTEPVAFFAGEIVIWTSLASVYLLGPGMWRAFLDPAQSTPASEKD
jgi:hypothetical protein